MSSVRITNFLFTDAGANSAIPLLRRSQNRRRVRFNLQQFPQVDESSGFACVMIRNGAAVGADYLNCYPVNGAQEIAFEGESAKDDWFGICFSLSDASPILGVVEEFSDDFHDDWDRAGTLPDPATPAGAT